jgi:hypothetical protein
MPDSTMAPSRDRKPDTDDETPRDDNGVE